MKETTENVIDWNHCLTTLGSEKLAQEILTRFAKELLEEMASLKTLYAQKNYPDLLKQIHRFHGSVAYVGCTSLKHATHTLEETLKHSTDHATLGVLLANLEKESERFLTAARQYEKF